MFTHHPPAAPAPPAQRARPATTATAPARTAWATGSGSAAAAMATPGRTRSCPLGVRQRRYRVRLATDGMQRRIS